MIKYLNKFRHWAGSKKDWLVKRISTTRIFPAALQRISRRCFGKWDSYWSYDAWIEANERHDASLTRTVGERDKSHVCPMVSIVMPVYNPSLSFLKEAIESVAGQTFGDWQLCIADASQQDSDARAFAESRGLEDSRIVYRKLSENRGIASNTNEAISMATGAYVAFMDHDDVLAPFALDEVAAYLQANPLCRYLYSDQDQLDESGKRHSPFFKPDWSPDLLQCFMYTGHLSVYERKLLEELGGLRSEYDLSQDYDLVLRAAAVLEDRQIGHIPKVLYHWRNHPISASAGGKPDARASNIKALKEAMVSGGYDVQVEALPTANWVRFADPIEQKISIIVPSDCWEHIALCIAGIRNTTARKNYEIVVVTNSDCAAKMRNTYDGEQNVIPLEFNERFNFSRKCNLGARHCGGEFVLFLNDDVTPLDPDWLGAMAGLFQQKAVGAVSPKLLYANDNIQHAGMVTGVRRLVGTAFHSLPRELTDYFNLAQSTRTASVLSAACLMMRKSVFEAIGGFDEVNTPIMNSDVDLCFKIREAGYRLVYTPFATLRHIGHVSIKAIEGEGKERHSSKADVYLLKRWGGCLANDPYFNKNMRARLYHDSPSPFQLVARNQEQPQPSKADVLVVSHELSLTGAPLILSKLIAALKKGYFFTVLSPSNGPLAELYAEMGVPVIVDELAFREPGQMEYLIDDFDVVIANTIVSWPLVKRAKAAGKPVLWMIHESNFGVELAAANPNIQDALGVADVITFPSESPEKRFRKYKKLNHYFSILCGVDIPECVARDEKRDASRMRIVCVGSVERRKGQQILMDALELIPKALLSRVEVSFLGHVLEVDYFRDLCARSVRYDNIKWRSPMSHGDTLSFIANSDILVCPSLDETGPLVVIEAMALGVPVITTQVGAVPELIKDQMDGLVVPPGNAQLLSGAIARMIDDASLRTTCAANAKLVAKSRLQFSRYANDIEKLLASLINRPAQ